MKGFADVDGFYKTSAIDIHCSIVVYRGDGEGTFCRLIHFWLPMILVWVEYSKYFVTWCTLIS